MENNIKQIKLSDIVNDLENGLTRFEKDNFGLGSIEKKYDLTFAEIIDLFKHPKLKHRKTRRMGNGLSFNIIDDIDDVIDIKGCECGEDVEKPMRLEAPTNIGIELLD